MWSTKDNTHLHTRTHIYKHIHTSLQKITNQWDLQVQKKQDGDIFVKTGMDQCDFTQIPWERLS